MKRIILILVLLQAVQLAAMDRVRVRIYAKEEIETFQVNAKRGIYAWVAYTSEGDIIDTISILSTGWNPKAYVKFHRDEVTVSQGLISIGNYERLKLVPYQEDSSWVMVYVEGKARRYSGELDFWVGDDGLVVVNDVNTQAYIAGVVESEAGHFTEPEFYKAQAVIARTWLLANQNKHIEEGYNVVDGVSSQAYYSMAYYTNADAITRAVLETGDSVVVDSIGEPIMGVFHSNSGGQTANSQDAWSTPIYYLQSVNDSFSLEGDKAFWEIEIDKNSLANFVARQLGVSSRDRNFRVALFNYHPEEREGSFTYNGKSMKWKLVRREFGLRSAWFSITEMGDEVLLKGRGFGHGVGLSQEGANIMAEYGYNWKAILAQYYPRTSIVSLSSL